MKENQVPKKDFEPLHPLYLDFSVTGCLSMGLPKEQSLTKGLCATPLTDVKYWGAGVKDKGNKAAKEGEPTLLGIIGPATVEYNCLPPIDRSSKKLHKLHPRTSHLRKETAKNLLTSSHFPLVKGCVS